MLLESEIITTEDEYRACLAEVERLAAFDPAPGTTDGDRLDFLARKIEYYEIERFRF